MTASLGDKAADPQQIIAELQRNLDEVTAQQVVTAEILRVIAKSPSDVQPVFDAIASSALGLFDGYVVSVVVVRDDRIESKAVAGFDAEASQSMIQLFPLSLDRESVTGRVILERTVIHVPDIAIDESDRAKVINKTVNVRALLGAPMQRDGTAIGAITVGRRHPGPFSDKQIMLLRTLADQAVIAIENTRLFSEVQAKTRDLSEALQQQTATTDVLKIISRSAFNLDTVLETLISTATRLCNCGPKGGQIFRREGDVYRYAASQMNVDPDYLRHEQSAEIKPGRGTLIGRVALSKRTVMITDAWSDPEYEEKDAAQTGNVRAMLGVPLLRDGEPIGAFALARGEPIAFTEREVELVTSFADQAVIAIENARLFNEVQARTEEVTEALEYQTATSDVLKVISRSAFDLQGVFNTLLESAASLIGASNGALCVREGEVFPYRAMIQSDPEWTTYLRAHPARAGLQSISGRVILSGKVETIADVQKDAEYDQSYWLEGHTSMIGVPLLRSGRVEGVFSLARPVAGDFTPREIDLIRTFADQAVIAIENTRLFDEVQARTKELAASLDDLRAAQDRLVQTEKLASLGQLTAGIAHEIKNPLNFVNNFSALSAELVAEMSDVLANTSLDTATREQLDQLAQMLKGNLEKVVQHGKRADSIVKNMLQHSREGSGEHRPADINAIVEESLNLAYHGARAEKAGFSIAFQRDLDPSVGMADIYPQEITRVLLNLISNGFYATTKRKAETGDGFEPILSATTKNLGDRVEIRIRDNGTGIPDEVKEKIFNPFFTTKPSGEGTGLGLSMSHDIVVKQHGGSIDVETEPGLFTEFKIVLPRTNQR